MNGDDLIDFEKIQLSSDNNDVDEYLARPDLIDQVASKNQLVGSLADYNLFLLRTIYESFEGKRGNKVLRNLRKNNFNVLKKAAFMMMS
jgi:hypothetical protein